MQEEARDGGGGGESRGVCSWRPSRLAPGRVWGGPGLRSRSRGRSWAEVRWPPALPASSLRIRRSGASRPAETELPGSSPHLHFVSDSAGRTSGPGQGPRSPASAVGVPGEPAGHFLLPSPTVARRSGGRDAYSALDSPRWKLRQIGGGVVTGSQTSGRVATPGDTELVVGWRMRNGRAGRAG